MFGDLGAFHSMLQDMFGGMAAARSVDDLYPKYHLPPMKQTEKNMQCLADPKTKAQSAAFVIANKIDVALEEGDDDEALKMAYHAMKLDPFSVDVWRACALVLGRDVDTSTKLFALREALNYGHGFFKDNFREEAGFFYRCLPTRCYIRLLSDIAHTAYSDDAVDIATFAYEEIIRLNHNDNTGARNQLLCCYLKLLGRRLSGLPCYPERTARHVESLIDGRLPGCDFTLFGNSEDSMTCRWGMILLAYYKNRPSKWQSRLKAEYAHSTWLFRFLFGEIASIPPAELRNHANRGPNFITDGFLVGSPQDDARMIAHPMAWALADWPKFCADIRRLFRKKNPLVPERHAYVPPNKTGAERKQHTAAGFEGVEASRFNMKNREFRAGVRALSNANREFQEAMLPSRALSDSTPFALFSNRQTCAAKQKNWFLARIDARFTLWLKPDHIPTYRRLPKIAEAFFCAPLVSAFRSIWDKEVVGQAGKKKAEEWRELADRCVGLLSLQGITVARRGALNAGMIESLKTIGMGDMFVPINVPSEEHHLLPWLTPADLETVVDAPIKRTRAGTKKQLCITYDPNASK